MNGSVFAPNIKPRQSEEKPALAMPDTDKTGGVLLKIAQYAVVLLAGLLPVFFTPGLWASLGFDKVLLSVVLGVVALIAVSLLTLRRGQMQTVIPVALVLFYAVVLSAFVSALLSGDTQDSIRGSVFETQTVGFLLVMGLVMSITLVFQGSKIMTIRALAAFAVLSTVLMIYNVLRIIFGAAFLPLGSFGVNTVSPIGGFNDLAIYAGLLVILGLITLLLLPLRGIIQYLISFMIVLGLSVLAVVNFFNIWLIIGFFGLLLFVYLLSKDTLFKSDSQESNQTPKVLILITAVVCIFSAVFIVAGDYAGAKINNLTGINYVEVRPSLEATIDITSAVYKNNVLLGAGPNRFVDSWRQYKDRSINETIFWDTDFVAGSGYIPTLFTNLGMLGALLMVAFHGYLLVIGYKMLARSKEQDSYWSFFSVFSFTGAAFLWGMSYIYVPGAGILLMAALFTGFTFVAYGAMVPGAAKRIPLAINRQRGFLLMAAIILIISGSIAVLFSVGGQYVAQAQFSQSQATAESIEVFEQVAFNSYGLYPDDRFVSARAQIKLAILNALVNIAEPTEEDQQRFLDAAEQGIIFAEQAVAEDPTNPDNHAILAGIYSNLAVAGIDGAQERASQSLAAAQLLDPLNPGYQLIAAQIAIRAGDATLAREGISAALNLKRNYTQALYLSAQLDIAEGNAESAIATTRAIITLEPNNPTRYYQLGILQSAIGSSTEAIASFQAAITVDPSYANARYLLALAYLNDGSTQTALTELRIVQQTNSENVELTALINQIESGDLSGVPNLGFEAPVNDAAPGEGFEDTVITDEAVDTNLVTPVNTISGTGVADETQPVTAPEESPE